MKRNAKAVVSRKRILDAAACIFRDFGYAGTTMRAIAKEANLEAGSIYYYFGTKDDLISAVLDSAMLELIESVRQSVEALPSSASNRDRIQVAITAHLTTIIKIGDYTLATRRVVGQVPDTIRIRNKVLREQYASLWQNILNHGRESHEFRTNANLAMARLYILGALNWTVEWYKPKGQPLDDIARDLASIVLDGLVGSQHPESVNAPVS